MKLNAMDFQNFTRVCPPEDELLHEAGHRGIPLRSAYSYQAHRAYVPNMQDHFHVYMKQNQIFSVNMDGSAHDRIHGSQIPNAAAIPLRDLGVDVPDNNLIESVDLT
jgi:hypothetical protein